jgi:hypothetical protein
MSRAVRECCPYRRAFVSLCATILENLKDSSEFQFIGISDVLVPNLRYKLYRKQNGALRYVTGPLERPVCLPLVAPRLIFSLQRSAYRIRSCFVYLK